MSDFTVKNKRTPLSCQYPNPISDFVEIKTKERIVKVEISDVSLKVVGTYADIGRPISLQHLAKGL